MRTVEAEPGRNPEQGPEAFLVRERGRERWGRIIWHGIADSVCFGSAVWLAFCASRYFDEGNSNAALVLGGVSLAYFAFGALLTHSFIIRLKSSAG